MRICINVCWLLTEENGCFQAFLSLFLQPFSIWLICSQSRPQIGPRPRLCAVMHSWQLCVCVSVCWGFNWFWKRADRTLMHRQNWAAFHFSAFFESRTWTASIPSIRTLTLANANRKAPVFAWCSPLLCGLRFSWHLLTAVTVEDCERVHFKLQTVWTSTGQSV